MESGIYDAKGRIIKGTIERIGEANVPASSITEGGVSVLSDNPGNAYAPTNYQGNIILKDTAGISVIKILKEGTILINDGTTNRILIGKQAGGF
jgi:hypothetical protein